MLNFFCLSSKVEDNISASAIVSAIAKKGFKCTLFVREIPYFAERYNNITFSAELPSALLRTRRSIHNDVVYDQHDENKQYINVWSKQLRGSFVCDSIDKTLLSITNHIIGILNIKQQVSIDDIIYASSSKRINTKTFCESTGIISVCFVPSAIDNFEKDATALSSIFSACSRATFYIFDHRQNYGQSNCKSFTEINAFIIAMIKSDIIILSSPVFILPYINIIKKQKLLFLSSIDKSSKIKSKGDFLPNATVNDIARYLRTLY